MTRFLRLIRSILSSSEVFHADLLRILAVASSAFECRQKKYEKATGWLLYSKDN